MWDVIDLAINLNESEIYSFEPDKHTDIEDPFWERGAVYVIMFLAVSHHGHI